MIVPTPAEVRQLVRRGHSVLFALPEDTEVPEVFRIARALQDALSADLRVLGAPGRSPALRVLQLVSDQEATSAQGGLERLADDFRRLSQRLVERLRVEILPAYERGESYPGRLRLDKTAWDVDIHGEHCKFKNSGNGTVVEANIFEPDDIDPYFLLLFARTSGGYPEVLSVCVEGFHDMCRLLDLAGFSHSAQ